MAGTKGKSGRKRLPTKTKKLRGTHQACRDNPNEIELDKLSGADIPDILRGDDMAEKIWGDVIAMMVQADILTQNVLPKIATYCKLISMEWEWNKAIEEEGGTFINLKMDLMGNEIREIKANPKVNQMLGFIKASQQIWTSLCLDPNSQMKFNRPEKPKVNPDDDLFDV